jgi:hypothetical protein
VVVKVHKDLTELRGKSPKQIWLKELYVLEMELKQIRQMLEKEPEFARFLYTPQG